MMIHGNLYSCFEHTEGILWAVESDEKLFILKNDDNLKIYEKEDHNIIWDDIIKFEYLGKHVCGMFVTDIQKQIDPKVWYNWFYNKSKAILIRKES